MTHVVAGSNEPFDSLLRRFTRKLQQDGLLSKVRRHESFETPGEKRICKEAANKKKAVSLGCQMINKGKVDWIQA